MNWAEFVLDINGRDTVVSDIDKQGHVILGGLLPSTMHRLSLVTVDEWGRRSAGDAIYIRTLDPAVAISPNTSNASPTSVPTTVEPTVTPTPSLQLPDPISTNGGVVLYTSDVIGVNSDIVVAFSYLAKG